MSHEIRTPMNAIIGMTGLLLTTKLDSEQRDYVETVRSAGDNLLLIINDILDFSKIEADRLELETQPFDLAECVASAVDLVARQAAGKGLELAYLVRQDCPAVVIGDVTRLRQVLANLLSNAVKFTSEGHVLLVVSRGAGTGDLVQFAVTDTGIGIPPERHNRLFQAFSQVDSSTTRTYGGTGLGLAISSRLVEAMGGQMWVESEIGRGSTFHFTATLPDHPAGAREPATPPGVRAVPERVLVVDDNETNLHILTYQVQAWGMACDSTTEPTTALGWVEEGRRYDVAILDMQMPFMDGAALATELKSGRSVTMPMILLTSLGERPDRPDTAQFAAVLTKPVRPSALFDALVEAHRPDLAATPATPPQPDPPLRIRAGKQELAEALAHQQLRVLVAEDNVVNQKVALRVLERLGYRADLVSNGLEALEAVHRQEYDVVFMDVQMPEMDGLEATRNIRAQCPANRQPHIVAMTANAFAEDRAACLSAGMDDYLSKPVRAEDLASALTRFPATEPATAADERTNKSS